MLRAASVFTVIAPMPGKCPKETDRSRETGSANSALQPRDRLYKPYAARGRSRQNEKAAQGRPISRPRPWRGSTPRSQQPSRLQTELREDGLLAPVSRVSHASRPGEDSGFPGLCEQDPVPGCTRPRSAWAGGGHWRVGEPGDFPFPLLCFPSGHRSARSPPTSPLLDGPCPVRRAAFRLPPLPGPDLHAPQVPASRAAALTQSAQQDGLAPFLRLRSLFVAGPEQRLEPSPGQRALHLAHGC